MNIQKVSIATIASLGLALSSTCLADTLMLRDGSQVNGTFVGATATTVSIKDASGVVHRYNTSRVSSVQFTSAAQTNNNSGFSSRNNRNNSNNRYSSNNQVRETVPVGTQLFIRTNDAIDSSAASANQTFSAQFDQDVIGSSSGRIVIPKGSNAQLVIRSVSSGSMTAGARAQFRRALTHG
jgi:beta-xylosidase